MILAILCELAMNQVRADIGGLVDPEAERQIGAAWQVAESGRQAGTLKVVS